MHTLRTWLSGMLLLSIASTLNATVEIPEHPLLSDDLVMTLGVFYPRSSTAASLGPSDGGSGAIISFEDALDLERRSLAASFGLFWRATDNWRVELEYYAINRDATRTLATDIDWGDLPPLISGTIVDSTFDFSDIRLSAAYAFFRRQDKEIGAGLGLHVADIKASLQAEGGSAEAADVTAPLPVVNLYSMFALTDKWALNMRVDWLSLTYGDYKGDVRNLEVSAIYQPFRNVGFGLGIRNMVVDIEVDSTDWRGRARLSHQGPTAFVTVSF